LIVSSRKTSVYVAAVMFYNLWVEQSISH
jgi:hypothetical protein